ncbi:hypothetical protein [Acidocella facilis]|uniref:hypothetical protein n=1 Tax=Acidocella facilis TaxID=525 RepID=UPI001F221D05|nr:hypothetical protein [Acidocella facilis]
MQKNTKNGKTKTATVLDFPVLPDVRPAPPAGFSFYAFILPLTRLSPSEPPRGRENATPEGTEKYPPSSNDSQWGYKEKTEKKVLFFDFLKIADLYRLYRESS